MRLKKITFLFIFIFMLSTIMGETAYASVPYNGYTYNAYGNSVSTAVCYQPDKYITGLDIGVGSLKNPQDMFVSNSNEIYILDSGNKRVIQLDEKLKVKKIIDQIVDENGKKYDLKNPSGIFVTEDKTIYIADTDNQVVIRINQQGKIEKKYSKPTTELFPQNVEFKPKKVIVDKAEDVYVVVDGVYQGAVMYNKNANFTGFYGTNKVEVNTAVLSDYFWKTFFMNKEQRRKTARYVPTTFTNFYIDNGGFIYVCSKDDSSQSNVLKKLNSLGTNVLRASKESLGYGDLESARFSGNQIKTTFVDVNADKDGFINVLDSTRGRVFQYDQDSNLIAIFGGKSNQVGTFNSPIAIASLNGKILVLDEKRGDITVYGLTEFGQWIHTAVKLYNDGLYEDSMEPWKEVLKRDNKLEIAYIGIGKAQLKAGEYKEAMKSFKLGYDVSDYSKAYGLYMSSVIRKNIGLIVGILVFLFVLVKLSKTRYIVTKRNNVAKYLKRKGKENLYEAG
jgi:hypothetical protein